MRGSFSLALAVLVVGFIAGPTYGQVAPPAAPEALVAAQLKALGETTGAERLAAIDALTEQGAAAAPATEALAKLLGDADEATQIRAAKALGSIGPGAAAAVDSLTAALEKASPKLLAYELFALGRIGEKAQAAFPKVAAQLTNEDAQVRREAIKAIRQMKLPLDTTVPVLVKVLESAKSTEEVMPALHAMSEVGKAGVPRLIEAMQKQPISRFWVCRILGEMGPDADAAVPAVTEALGDEKTDVRREAVLCLGHIGKAAGSATEKLKSLLADPDAGIRAASIWALMMVDASPADIATGVKPLLKDSDEMVRIVAAWSVTKSEPGDAAQRRASLDAFIAGLKNENPRIRAASARAIVDLKAGDPAAREALIEKMADGDMHVSSVVRQALLEAGEESVPRLIEGLDRKELRGFAAQTLGMLGPKAKAAVPALSALLADDDAQIRAVATHSIGVIAPDDQAVVAKVVAALGDKSTDVRLAAIDALTMNKAAAATAKPELEKLAADPNPAVSAAAKFAIEAGKAE